MPSESRVQVQYSAKTVADSDSVEEEFRITQWKGKSRRTLTLTRSEASDVHNIIAFHLSTHIPGTIVAESKARTDEG